MKAIVYHQYGSPDVLRLEDIPQPELAEDRVLVRVHAASPNPYDWHFMRGKPWIMRIGSGFLKPKQIRLGADLAGVVEAVGRQVTMFKPGDAVFGQGVGAFAEYVVVKPTSVARKPANLTFEQAATIPIPGYTALQALRDHGKVTAGHTVLINGASGGVGTFAVQIAKAFGAEVTGVCSGRNAELVRSIGADHVIDYTKEDFVSGERRYDLILDNVGSRSLSDCRRMLTPSGKYVLIGADRDRGGPLFRFVKVSILSMLGSRNITGMMARPRQEDLYVMKDLIEAGKVTPVIDRAFPLREVPEAMRYLEEGHVRGKIVITVRQS